MVGILFTVMTMSTCLLSIIEPLHGEVLSEFSTPQTETWTGRWLPERPAFQTTENPLRIMSDIQGVKMGVPSSECDDAKTNLTMDWDFSAVNYTCYYPTMKFVPDRELKPIMEHENIPKYYVAQHKCMDEPIYYSSELPTFGTHRPLWPRYGEYKFVPIQRWLHNLEHGGIVMLYHPCANPLEVNRLRQIVTGCLRRHLITPYNLLSPKRPLALLSWGWRMTMSTVQPDIVREFIKQHALQGAEAISRDGFYDTGLLVPAKILTSVDDDLICPHSSQQL